MNIRKVTANLSRNKRFKLEVSALLALGALVLGIGLAQAGDRKTYPGANCVGDPASYLDIDSNGHVENMSTSTLTLICPIVRDVWVTGTQTGNVWVNDLHYSQNVCCQARSKNAGGNSVRFTSSQCSTGVVSNHRLNFTGPSMAGTWSHRYYRCTVPGTYSGNRSEITTYRSQEI